MGFFNTECARLKAQRINGVTE